jgi:hypothetical protein
MSSAEGIPLRLLCGMERPMDTHLLIKDLQSIVRDQSRRMDQWMELPIGRLEQRPGPQAWSALEIAEHLNILSGHYVRRLRKAYAGDGVFFKDEFLPGRWGEKLTTSMRPLPDGTVPGPMRTLWLFEPKAARAKGIESLQDFRALLEEEATLLDEALSRGVEGPRITSTLGPILRFKIGDAFRFTIAHQQRHFLQIERALQAVVGGSTGKVADGQNPVPTASPLM